MDNYRRKFEVSAAPLQNVPEEVLEGIFANGLKAEIRAELRLLKPEGLTEEKNLLLRRELGVQRFWKPQQVGSNGLQPAPGVAAETFGNPEKLKEEVPFRKLSDSELQEKRNKGERTMF